MSMLCLCWPTEGLQQGGMRAVSLIFLDLAMIWDLLLQKAMADGSINTQGKQQCPISGWPDLKLHVFSRPFTHTHSAWMDVLIQAHCQKNDRGL